MDKEVKNWVDSAHYDLETAAHLFNTGRYVYTIFMCHLSLEKILKAKVQEVTGKVPPKTHNLRYLVKLGKLEIPEDIFEFLSKLSDVSIPTRYPRDFNQLIESYKREAANEYLDKTKEVFEWLRRLLKQ
ncbi:MAG: hypothetical protein A2Y81_06750 [Nitrospirae bacterium RBG_13_43_8]|jgi:HEPN domain-containing protein|nr:MAG: hypothetical protein A2Y81_06750 [Nitrospirae bacterium RBG_13_43_8]